MNTVKRFWALCLDTHMKLALYKYAIIIIIINIIWGDDPDWDVQRFPVPLRVPVIQANRDGQRCHHATKYVIGDIPGENIFQIIWNMIMKWNMSSGCPNLFKWRVSCFSWCHSKKLACQRDMLCFNSLVPSDAIWRQEHWSALAHIQTSWNPPVLGPQSVKTVEDRWKPYSAGPPVR